MADDLKYSDYQTHDTKVDCMSAIGGLDIEFIVSIDFGSYGFAASFCRVGVPEHQRIIKNWNCESFSAATDLNKNLAALLIEKNTNKTIAIGYEAESLYAKLIERNEDDNYMYFQHFKPYLYSTDHLNKNQNILSADKQSSLPLSILIKKSFESVMKHSINYINEFQKLAQQKIINKNDIFWVIAVPAIWDEMSKLMMKLCAKQAGMNHFKLGLEPIVSAFDVINDSDWKYNKMNNNDNKFIVLDCGGGTVDASFIEIINNNYIKELHFSDGIRCGGLDIDYKYIELIEELLPNDIINKIKKKKPGQWIRQQQEFAQAKFSVPKDLGFDKKWNVQCCFGLSKWIASKWKKRRNDQTFGILKKKFNDFKLLNNDNDNVSMFDLGKSNIKISGKGWLYLHEETLMKIIQFLRKLFRDSMISNCRNLIVTGGFAHSKYLINRLKKEFPFYYIISPKQAHLSVTRGCLYWICNEKILKKTRPKYSYGIGIDIKWDKYKHLLNRKQLCLSTQEYIVKNAFGMLVEKNQEYSNGYRQIFPYYIQKNTNTLLIVLYASQDKYCQYIYDNNGNLPTNNGKKCFKVKQFVLKLNKIFDKKTLFNITLEYNQSGINLYFIDPNDNKTEIKVEIDTSTVLS